jgi:sulfatase maturation enzyme AslB (radical SAM superfamily)
MKLGLLRRKKEEKKRCGDCVFFDASSKLCKKLWIPVSPEAEGCEYYKKRGE